MAGPKKTNTKILENRGTKRNRYKSSGSTTAIDLNEYLQQFLPEYQDLDFGKILKLIPNYDPFLDEKGFHFCTEKAIKAIAFFEKCLVFVDGNSASEPFILQDWQRSIIANLEGWRTEDGHKRYKEAFLLIARGAGKSCLASGYGLYNLLCLPQYAGKQIIVCASDKNQAGEIHRVSKQMVLTSEQLGNNWEAGEIGIYKDSITLQDFESFQTVSSDAKRREGGKVFLCLFDELHVQQKPQLYSVMRKSCAKVKGSLFFSISTAGSNTTSICYDQYQYCKQLLDRSVFDPSFLPVIFEPKEGADWKESSTWKAANPNIGVSIAEDDIRILAKKAEVLPIEEADFRVKYCNQWTNLADRWIRTEEYDQCPNKLPSEEQLKASVAYGGLDLGLTNDLSAFVLYFPEFKCCKCWCWIPEEDIQLKEIREEARYLVWSKMGFLTITSGATRKDSQIKEDILSICSNYNVKKIGADAAYANELLNEMIAARVPLFEYRQGYISMTAPCKELERLILAHEFNHGANPLLKYCLESTTLKVRQDTGTDACHPIKAKNNLKIDVVLALVDAIGIYLKEPIKISTYTQRAQGLIGNSVLQSKSTYASRNINDIKF